MFKKGLNDKLQAELACKAVDLSYNDFITLAIKIDNLMRNSQRSCRSISSSLEQAQKYLDSCKLPQFASPPRKEVDVSGRNCATTVEMRIIIMLPIHIKPRNLPGNPHSVSTIEISIPSRCSFLLSCELGFDTAVQCVSALVDSGSAVNVINQDLTNKFKIPTLPCVPAINITAIDNSPIGSGITATTQPVTLQIGLFHKETIPFYVVPSCKYEVILSHP